MCNYFHFSKRFYNWLHSAPLGARAIFWPQAWYWKLENLFNLSELLFEIWIYQRPCKIPLEVWFRETDHFFCQNHEISRKLTIFFQNCKPWSIDMVKKVFYDKFSILSYMLGNPSNQLSKRIGFVVVFSKTRLIPIHVCFDIFFVYVIHNI